MIHIVGSKGVIGSHLKNILKAREELFLHESGSWNFSSVKKDDLVFFLRSVSSPFKVMNDPIASARLNVTNTKVGISKMLSTGARIIFASSDVVYGDTQNNLVDENARINPYGEYAIQKAAVEEHFKNEPNFLSLRISLVVGEGSKLRKLLLSNDVVEIFDPVIRSPIHVNDLGFLCSKLLNSEFRQDFPNGILNVGGNTPMSTFEIANLEAKFLGVTSPIVGLRTALDKACRPGTVRMVTIKAQEFTKLSLDPTEHYG